MATCKLPRAAWRASTCSRTTYPPPRSSVFRRHIATFEPASSIEATSIIQSTVDKSSPEYQDNARRMADMIDELTSLSRTVQKGGSDAARKKHVDRGKMLPRDRITALIDPGSTFLELSPLAGHELYPEASTPAGGIITGIGTVSGVQCMIVANDSTVKGGTYYPITVKKHLRAQAIAQENRLPCIYLVDSGGANLPHQADVFPDRDHFGRIFYNQARMSAMGIPQIAVVMGPCTAGGAYVPAMSDESIIVRNQGHIFLAGPPLVKAATGEVVTAEELGGGEMHSSVSGVTDYLAVSDAHALVLARRCVANINDGGATSSTSSSSTSPLYPVSELDALAPTNLRVPLAMHEIIARLVDGSQFSSFKPTFGTTLITGFARIHGHPVGILASAGPLYAASAQKGAHFIQLCAKRGVPLVFLQNISGFMVGTAAERDGIAKHGAKLVMAVACADVPKFTIVVGGSFGAGNYGMCGRAYGPRFLWTWPSARTAVMGSEQLGGVMDSVRAGKQGGASQEGTRSDAAPDAGSSAHQDAPPPPAQDKSQSQSEDAAALRRRIEHESTAIFGSARLWDDGIILPSQTRTYLGLGLRAAAAGMQRTGGGAGGRFVRDSTFGVFRM